MPQQMNPRLHQLIKNFAAAAKKMKVTELVIGVRDPITGTVQAFATNEAQRDDSMRHALAARMDLEIPADAAWPDQF